MVKDFPWYASCETWDEFLLWKPDDTLNEDERALQTRQFNLFRSNTIQRNPNPANAYLQSRQKPAALLLRKKQMEARKNAFDEQRRARGHHDEQDESARFSVEEKEQRVRDVKLFLDEIRIAHEKGCGLRGSIPYNPFVHNPVLTRALDMYTSGLLNRLHISHFLRAALKQAIFSWSAAEKSIVDDIMYASTRTKSPVTEHFRHHVLFESRNANIAPGLFQLDSKSPLLDSNNMLALLMFVMPDNANPKYDVLRHVIQTLSATYWPIRGDCRRMHRYGVAMAHNIIYLTHQTALKDDQRAVVIRETLLQHLISLVNHHLTRPHTTVVVCKLNIIADTLADNNTSPDLVQKIRAHVAALEKTPLVKKSIAKAAAAAECAALECASEESVQQYEQKEQQQVISYVEGNVEQFLDMDNLSAAVKLLEKRRHPALSVFRDLEYEWRLEDKGPRRIGEQHERIRQARHKYLLEMFDKKRDVPKVRPKMPVRFYMNSDDPAHVALREKMEKLKSSIRVRDATGQVIQNGYDERSPQPEEEAVVDGVTLYQKCLTTNESYNISKKIVDADKNSELCWGDSVHGSRRMSAESFAWMKDVQSKLETRLGVSLRAIEVHKGDHYDHTTDDTSALSVPHTAAYILSVQNTTISLLDAKGFRKVLLLPPGSLCRLRPQWSWQHRTLGNHVVVFASTTTKTDRDERSIKRQRCEPVESSTPPATLAASPESTISPATPDTSPEPNTSPPIEPRKVVEHGLTAFHDVLTEAEVDNICQRIESAEKSHELSWEDGQTGSCRLAHASSFEWLSDMQTLLDSRLKLSLKPVIVYKGGDEEREKSECCEGVKYALVLGNVDLWIGKGKAEPQAVYMPSGSVYRVQPKLTLMHSNWKGKHILTFA